MADYQGISFSMKTSTPNNTEADIVAFDQCSVFGLPDASVMLKSHRSGMRVLVPADIFGLMQNCVHYKTIAQHVEHLLVVDPSMTPHKEQLQQILEDLTNQGLMDSGQRLISKLKLAGSTSQENTSFAGVFIRTCDRPQQLMRLLEGLSQNQQKFGHQHPCIVVDDSRKADSQQQNLEICDDYENSGKLSIEYYGVQQQTEFINQLCQHFSEHQDTIQWLLGRQENFDETMFTGGRLLNHIVLKAAGHRFALFDDDAVCQPYQSPKMQHHWSFKSSPKDTWFYQNRDQMFTEIQELELDPLANHLDVLGKSLGELVSDLSAVKLDANALHGVSSANSLALKTDTQVFITRNGTFGDPGTSLMTWIYQQEDESLEHLNQDPEKFKHYSVNRTTWLGSNRFRAVNENSLMTTTLTGINGEQLIPPTGPCYRNEDYLFSRLVKFIHPDSLSFEFPWGLPHLPEPPRQWHPAKLDEPKTVGILGFMADIANNVERYCLAESAQQRLSYIGETYRALADASLMDLYQGVEENLLNARAATINEMQVTLDKHSDQPQYWKDDVQRIITANKNAIAQPEQTLFPDVGAGQTPETQTQSCQEMLGMFGDALKIWPMIWTYCQQND